MDDVVTKVTLPNVMSHCMDEPQRFLPGLDEKHNAECRVS